MIEKQNVPDISVLIPTYNRAQILRETLEAMSLVERDGLAVEFVVIDNNSKDNTKEVVESFVNKIPLRYLFEPRPGKNCALNKALDEVELGEIVVFTDDDVTPQTDWLKQIVETTGRWPKYDVFGGAIYPIWPDGQPPKWLGAGPECAGYGLRGHGQNISEKECLYSQKNAPCGANMWVRKKIFNNGSRFNVSIGPSPGIYITGSETSFLYRLQKEGYNSIFSAYPAVGHRIQRELLSHAKIRRRAISMGRGSVRTWGLCYNELLHRSALLWCGLRFGSLVWAVLRYLNPINYLRGSHGYTARLEAISDIAYNIESFHVFRESARKYELPSQKQDNYSQKV